MPAGFVVRVKWGWQGEHGAYSANYFCKTEDEVRKKIREKLDGIIEDYSKDDKRVFFFNYEIESHVIY